MGTSSRVHPSCIGLFLAVLMLAACGSEDEVPSDPYDLRAELQGDPSVDRRWVEPAVEKRAVLSGNEAYNLFDPKAIRILAHGSILVFNYGSYTAKAFDQEGTYLTTYGRGRGSGPGQVRRLTDAGLWRDSLIYLVDPRQRGVLFFEKDGEFVRVQRDIDNPFYRLAWADDSTKYMKPPDAPGRPFLNVATSKGTFAVVQPPVRTVEDIMLAGDLHAGQQRAIYSPSYLPFLLTYAPSDTTGVAHPTPDYGESLPVPGEENRAPSRQMNGPSQFSGGVLTVEHPTPDVDSLAFDLYEVVDMEYMHSIRFPAEGEESVYAYGAGTVAVLHDTTVTIYKVQHPQK